MTMHSRNLRDNTLLHLPKVNTKTGQTTSQYAAAERIGTVSQDLSGKSVEV